MSEREEKAKQLLQGWVDKQGHNRCWYYPEIFRQLCDLFEVTAENEPVLPPLAEFKQGCVRYQLDEYENETEAAN